VLRWRVRGEQMQLKAAFLVVLVAPIAACGVDSYLTCGAPCEDGGAGDATVPDTGSGDSGVADAAKDAPGDVTTGDSGCKGDGGYCQKGSDCCSSACNASNRCVASCASQGGACGSTSGCCVGMFCADGGCAACYADNAPCTNDNQCCGGNCTGGYDGGTHHCSSGGGGGN